MKGKAGKRRQGNAAHGKHCQLSKGMVLGK